MTFKVFNRCFLGFCALIVSVLVTMNVTLDPFGVFRTSTLPESPSSNERYLKIHHLDTNRYKFDSLILGSSRSGMSDPGWYESSTGLRTYNLSVFSGKPSDMITLLKLAARSQDITHVFVGIDAMSFLNEPQDEDLSRRHHPDSSETGKVSYWLDYLLAPSFIVVGEKIIGREAPPVVFNYELGTYALLGYDRAIAEDHEQYKEDTFGNWSAGYHSVGFNKDEWEALLRLREVIAEKGYEAKYFLQPMHKQWKHRMSSTLKELMPKLNELGDVIDFSDLGSENDDLWYEQRHYRKGIAKEIADRLTMSVAH